MKIGGREQYLMTARTSGPLEELVAAAKDEGELNVIALPHEWSGYGCIISAFKLRYGLVVNELQTNAASMNELIAIKLAQRSSCAVAPDVIDIGISSVREAKRDGLLQPYKVSRWAEIPGFAKDADGYWCGDYSGSIVFEVNADRIAVMPDGWADLGDPAYRGTIGVAGGLASYQMIQTVFAAGMSLANGDVEAAPVQGLRFFADLAHRGNLVEDASDLPTLLAGRTSILMRWDFLALRDRDRLDGRCKIEVVRPKEGCVGGIYAQAISAFAPHPNAARLWMEHLYSSESRAMRVAAHGHPIQKAEMAQEDKARDYRKVWPVQHRSSHDSPKPYFPSIEVQEKAKDIITKGWEGIVGVPLKCNTDPNLPDVPMSYREAGGEFA